jgi:hypothetical protein
LSALEVGRTWRHTAAPHHWGRRDENKPIVDEYRATLEAEFKDNNPHKDIKDFTLALLTKARIIAFSRLSKDEQEAEREAARHVKFEDMSPDNR